MNQLAFLHFQGDPCVQRYRDTLGPYLDRYHPRVHRVFLGPAAPPDGPEGVQLVGYDPQVAVLVVPPWKVPMISVASGLDGVIDVPRLVILPADPMEDNRLAHLVRGRQEILIYPSPVASWKRSQIGLKNPIGVEPIGLDRADPRVFYVSFFMGPDKRPHFRSGWLRP